MVSRGLGILAAVLLLTTPAAGSAAAGPFSLTVKSRQVEYGKPVYVELRSRRAAPALDSIDLSPLEADFAVETPHNVDDVTSSGEQVWRIRLYPRRPGALSIPPLSFHGAQTRPLAVTATPAIDQNDVPIHVTVPDGGKRAVWANQAVPVTIEIDSASPHAVIDAEEVPHGDIEILKLPVTKRTAPEPAGGRTRYRFRWMIYPQSAGDYPLQLPPVRYTRDGVITHRFYPPGVELHVRALPTYVPPTMPVGPIRIEASLPDRLFLVKNELAFLTLRITDAGRPGRNHARLLRQLGSDSTIRFYAPRRLDSRSSASEWQTAYRVPFAPQTMGVVAPPSLRVQYFDPTTGKIQTRVHRFGRLLVLGRWTLAVVAVLLALAALVVSRALYRRLHAKWRAYRSYRAALFNIRRAGTPAALKAALRDVADAEGWPTNGTLALWREKWTARYPRMASVGDSLLHLQAGLYGRFDADTESIRADLLDACYRRMPLLRVRDRALRCLRRVPRPR